MKAYQIEVNGHKIRLLADEVIDANKATEFATLHSIETADRELFRQAMAAVKKFAFAGQYNATVMYLNPQHKLDKCPISVAAFKELGYRTYEQEMQGFVRPCHALTLFWGPMSDSEHEYLKSKGDS